MTKLAGSRQTMEGAGVSDRDEEGGNPIIARAALTLHPGLSPGCFPSVEAGSAAHTLGHSLALHDNEKWNLAQAVMGHASASPLEAAVSWLKDDGSIDSTFTWAELWHFSSMLGEKLITKHRMQRGDRCMIVYPFGLDFIIAFLACLRVGIVVVSVYPPNPSKLEVDIPKFAHFVSDSQAKIALTTRKFASMVRYTKLVHKWPKSLSWVSTDSYPRNTTPLFPRVISGEATFTDSDLAFVQYTSGSTGSPKGVCITHGNLRHQLSVLSSLAGVKADTRCYVGWTPQYHDMGLFNVLTALFTRTPAVMMSPIQFINNPVLWPRAIERYRASWVCGPNFAYALTCKRMQQQDVRFDCSSVKFAGLGAEPTHASTMDSIVDVLGIAHEAIANMYGLAETCVFATGSVEGPVLDGSRVSVGGLEFSRGHGITVVVAVLGEGGALHAAEDDGVEGEVCLQSPSVAAGYWGKEELSRSTFEAAIEGREGVFLRTGDLGYCKEGRLYLSGRLKDLIIVNGRNVYPSDLEYCAERAFPTLLRPGSSAAFQATDDAAVLVCELREGQPGGVEVAAQVRGVVERECGVALQQLLLVGKGQVPKTTSGKVERGRTALLLKDGRLLAVAQAGSEQEPRLDQASSLTELLELCGVDDFGATVVENGLTSLHVMELVNAAHKYLDLHLDYQELSTLSAAQLVALHSDDSVTELLSTPPMLLVSPTPADAPPRPRRARRLLWQAAILLLQAVAVSAAVVPAVAVVEALFDSSDRRWASRGRAGPLVLLAVVLWMLSFTVVCICLKWVLVGRMKAGYLSLWSARFAAWMAVERIFSLWEYAVGRFLLQTPWLNVVYLLLGARVSFTARLDTFFRCWDLVCIEAGASVSGSLYPRVFDSYGVHIGAIHVELGASVGSMAVVQGPSHIHQRVTVEPSTVVPPHSDLAPADSCWHGNLCRCRPDAPAPSFAAARAVHEEGSAAVREAALRRERPKPCSTGDCSIVCEATTQAIELVQPTETTPLSPSMGADKAVCAVSPTREGTGYSEDQWRNAAGDDPWWATRAAAPLLFLAVSVSAYTFASSLLPIVDPLAPAWSGAAVVAALSYVGCFLLTGLQLAALVVLLKWSFLSPFLTDMFGGISIGTFLPFVERSPPLVRAWFRLLGMRIEDDACVLFSWTCAPSKAHLVSLGKQCAIFSSLLAPHAAPSLLASLRGRRPWPWSEPRDIVISDGVGLYAQSRVEAHCCLGAAAQIAAFARVEAETQVPPGSVMAGSPCMQIGSPQHPARGAANSSAHAEGADRQLRDSDEVHGFVGIGGWGEAVSLVLLVGHLVVVTGVMVVGVQLEKALPGAKELGGPYVAVLVRVAVLMAWIVGSLVGEVVVYKRLVLGRAEAVRVSLRSWQALWILHGCMLWEQLVLLLAALLAGGFGYDCVLWMLGYEIEVGMVVNMSICPPLQDAELITIEADAVIDELAYLSSHNVTTAGVTRAPTRVARGAVLHPLSALFLSTAGRDATLFPRAKTLREVDIGDGQTWAGSPARQAVCQFVADVDEEV